MMKTDVLNLFKTLSVGVGYQINGVIEEQVPYDLSQNENIPVLKDFKGWNSRLGIRKDDKIPVELEDYVSFIEKETGVPIKIISYGPDREQVITRKN